jgi:hypothetical protein
MAIVKVHTSRGIRYRDNVKNVFVKAPKKTAAKKAAAKKATIKRVSAAKRALAKRAATASKRSYGARSRGMHAGVRKSVQSSQSQRAASASRYPTAAAAVKAVQAASSNTSKADMDAIMNKFANPAHHAMVLPKAVQTPSAQKAIQQAWMQMRGA